MSFLDGLVRSKHWRGSPVREGILDAENQLPWLLKDKMKLRTLESRNLTPLFHICLLKSRKSNPTDEILSHQIREIK